MRNEMLWLETQFLVQKHDFSIGNQIFRLAKQFLDWKRDFQIRKNIFRLETRFLDQKQIFYIRNGTFRFETRFLDQKQDFQIRNKIFRLETRFSIQKLFLSKNIFLALLGHRKHVIWRKLFFAMRSVPCKVLLVTLLIIKTTKEAILNNNLKSTLD